MSPFRYKYIVHTVRLSASVLDIQLTDDDARLVVAGAACMGANLPAL